MDRKLSDKGKVKHRLKRKGNKVIAVVGKEIVSSPDFRQINTELISVDEDHMVLIILNIDLFRTKPSSIKP